MPILVVYVVIFGCPLYSADLYLSIMGFAVVKMAFVDQMFMFELACCGFEGIVQRNEGSKESSHFITFAQLLYVTLREREHLLN